MSPDDERHGTTAGYAVHRRAGEQPCAPCCEAKNAYNRALANGEIEDRIALTGGRWVSVRGVLRWRPEPEVPAPAVTKRPGRASLPITYTRDELLRASRQYKAGMRDEWTIEGRRQHRRLQARKWRWQRSEAA